jgi:hypothetical protein
MTVERGLRGVAGVLILLSVALGYWVHPAFFLFTAFVGVNLFQSAFTNACPMMAILRKAGFQDSESPGRAAIPRDLPARS